MSHGSRGRIQRRKSRAAALQIELLEERRLLSASRSAAHTAAVHPLDSSVAAEISGSPYSHQRDPFDAASGKGAKTPASIEPIKPVNTDHAVGHGVLGEPPGAIVSGQAKQLSSLDRPSDGPASGQGWALGHLISKSSYNKPDPSNNPLPATPAALPTPAVWTIAAPWSPSISKETKLNDDGDRFSVKSNWSAALESSPGTSQIIAAAQQYWWTKEAQPVNSYSPSLPGKAVLTPPKSTEGKITSTSLVSSTSKTIIDEEGDKHKVLVTASSQKATWSIDSQSKSGSQTPNQPPKPVPPRPTGGNPLANTPVKIIASPSAPLSAPPQPTGPANPTPGVKIIASAAAPPISATSVKIIAGPSVPPITSEPSGEDQPGEPPVDRSQAAIASQDEAKQAEAVEEVEVPAAAQMPPAPPAPPVDPSAEPTASLEDPRLHVGRQAEPLQAESRSVEGVDLGRSQLEWVDNAQQAATAMAGLWANVATSDPGSLLAKACDALAVNLPVDAVALDEALADLLDELEDLGNDLASSLAQAGVSPWIAAASLGAAAGAAHRRRQRRLREASKLGTRAAVLTQFPELLGLVPRGDA